MGTGKNLLVKAIGPARYYNTLHYASDLYHSLFLDLKEPGMRWAMEFISPGDTVCDIGANIGQFSRMAASRVGKNGRVFAFEPLSFPHKVLSKMVRLGRYSQIKPVKAALSDKQGTLPMFVPMDEGWKPKPGLAHLGGSASKDCIEETVDVFTLDLFATENKIGRINFIKCDAEGWETFVFKGAQQILVRHHPRLYVEIEQRHFLRSGADINELFGLFKGLGYVAMLPGPDGQLVKVEKYERPDNYFFL